MEGAIRNLVSKKVLNCMNGAFSDKWLDVSKRCGKNAEGLQVPWVRPSAPRPWTKNSPPASLTRSR